MIKEELKENSTTLTREEILKRIESALDQYKDDEIKAFVFVLSEGVTVTARIDGTNDLLIKMLSYSIKKLGE